MTQPRGYMQLFMQETTLKPMHSQKCGLYFKKKTISYMYSHIDSVGSVMFVERSSRHQETQEEDEKH